jgi:hypothetical protein
MPVIIRRTDLTIRKLKKKKGDGTRYKRRPVVEEEIKLALTLDPKIILARAQVPREPWELSSEAIVYFIRGAMEKGRAHVYNPLLDALLKRCILTLKKGIWDSDKFDAQYVRETALSDFADLFADENTHPTDKLDFFEVQFNLAFRAVYLTSIEDEELKWRWAPPIVKDKDGQEREVLEPELGDRSLERGPAFTLAALAEMAAELEKLPEDLRKAFVLHVVEGHKVEAKPGEKSVATECGVSGRAIRMRLEKVAKLAPRLKEYLE